MNVLDYSIRLGKLLRKTEEGREILRLKTEIEDKYRENSDFDQYKNYVEIKSSQYYFYSWDMAYHSFLNVLTDESIEHRELFLTTAELLSSDDKIKSLAALLVSFGHIFNQIVLVIIGGRGQEENVTDNWKYKVKNAISDVQIAVERTLLVRSMISFYQKNNRSFDNEETQRYLSKHDEKSILPFSDKAMKLMDEETEVSNEEKLLLEKLYLVMEAIKKGIFYGFFGMINEIQREEILDSMDFTDITLKEVSFSHKNTFSLLLNHVWLYRIQLEKEYMYFMAHEKQIHIDTEMTEVSGIVYPEDDRGMFDTLQQ